jgi:flagellar secretion chaperone FliS
MAVFRIDRCLRRCAKAGVFAAATFIRHLESSYGMSYGRSNSVAAYQASAAHGGVEASDPHGLITMLLDGALQRIAKARGCIVNKSYTEKAQLIHRSVAIIDELSGCLDLQAGGDVAKNLRELYDYIARKLLQATVENNVAILEEVSKLLQGLRDAWATIPKDVRSSVRK